MSKYKQCSYECPNCGQVFDFNTCKLLAFTIPKHETTVPTKALCPGSGQSGITVYHLRNNDNAKVQRTK